MTLQVTQSGRSGPCWVISYNDGAVLQVLLSEMPSPPHAILCSPRVVKFGKVSRRLASLGALVSADYAVLRAGVVS